MSIEITFLGHAGFIFSDGQDQLIVDPFLTGNPLAKHQPDQVKGNYLALTHGHEDHVGDTVAIAKANDATCIACYEIAGWLGEQGIEKVEPGNPGGTIQTRFGSVTFTKAFHSSSYQGRYMGMPCGLIIEMGGITLYHLGDTDIFGDMKLYGDLYKPDIALVPIGDRFTMGPALAARATEMIHPKIAIPVHYATFPPLVQSAEAFNPDVPVEVKIMAPGDTWSYGK